MASKILVLDDDYSNAEAIKAVLEDHAFEVMSICHSDELENTLRRFRPDLLVMDILLDKGDGRELCNNIKAGHDTGHIPVLLITAMLESQAAQVSSLADAIIFKPFDCATLHRKVNRLIRH